MTIPLKSKLEELENENYRLSLRIKALEQEQASAPARSSPSPRKERKGQKKGPKPLNPDLPRFEEYVPDPDLKELICPVTGALMRCVFDEKVEVLARKPAQYFVRVLKRRVFASPQGDAMAYSPWPGDTMPRNRIDASVVGSILCARFADHQPYNRQSESLARHGVDLARNTICSLVGLAADKLGRVYQAVVQQTLSHNYLMMDPTPVPLLSDQKKGSTKEACLWTYRALDGPVFFEFAEGKQGATPAKTLQHYTGILQTDGANNFGGVPARADITHLNCWAHVRRYFVKAEESGDGRAAEYLDIIDRLFRRERIARRFRLEPESLLELRRRFSLPEVDALYAKARSFLETERLLKTPMPKAIQYVLGRTVPLRECFLHAPSRIDNNLAEGALRARSERTSEDSLSLVTEKNLLKTVNRMLF